MVYSNNSWLSTSKRMFCPWLSLLCTAHAEIFRVLISSNKSPFSVYTENSSPSVKNSQLVFCFFFLPCSPLEPLLPFSPVGPGVPGGPSSLVYLLAHRVLKQKTNIVLNGSYRIKGKVANHPSLPETSPVSITEVLKIEETLIPVQTGTTGHPTCYNLLPKEEKKTEKWTRGIWNTAF